MIYRFFCLNSHYRKTLEFSYDVMDSMKNSYEKLINKIKTLKMVGDFEEEKFKQYKNKFQSCLEDDLNTANAISVLYEVLKDDLTDYTKLQLIMDFDTVLSLNLYSEENNITIDEFLLEHINEMIEERNEAKKNKDYAKADFIRNSLLDEGVILKDTREGTTFEIKK